MAVNARIPKGTRDFTPEVMLRRNYIFNTIKEVFHQYGYLPIETPAMENLSTLMGKYGEEGDRLLFKILNSGDYLAKADENALNEKDSNKLISSISEKGLRYDLTVPFARFVVQNRNELSFPFKRYQIQPVWRADRPQKGRYREFYQCDVDVIGSDSLLNEVELIQIVNDVYNRLRLNACFRINNRKILAGLAEIAGASDKMTDMTVAIDKLDKIGLDKVCQELESKDIATNSINKIKEVLALEGSNLEKLNFLKDQFSGSEIGLKGVEELRSVLDYLAPLPIKMDLLFDVTLARGLNYYTGAIFEVSAKDAKMGSITGGGRYDNLTGVFGLKDMSGVGLSFGADRIYDVMLQLGLFEKITNLDQTQLFFVNFGEKEANYCLQLLTRLRNADINAELYPDSAKMKKQMTYANQKNIPYVALIGESEMESGLISLKNMTTGEQQKLSLEEVINVIKR
ncbi:histidyl-tRNA synthetase [Balneicella halophila]|uniref:Histidine--tRNA ligase n=1 Tax=Balneicella halophila TaxID=1537566 RepID=A0A7L4UP26_BALHA|nr:histidine--tRNA ligase [Balneicella halophila]PVX50871.1 histidyl-tRNA synthetase [Balneicella halophila]